MKKFTDTIVTAIVFVASNLGLNAQEMPKADDVLKKAQDISNQPGSLHMEIKVKGAVGDAQTSVADYKIRPDGTYFMRTENMIVRPDGHYQLFPNQKKAALLKYMSVAPEDMAIMSALKDKTPSSMQIKKEEYAGKPCYVIDEKIPQQIQDAAKAFMLKRSSSKKEQADNQISENIPIPARKVYKISIPECQMLLQEIYDTEGNLISSISYENISKDDIADSYFDIPKDYEVIEFLNSEDFSKWSFENVM